MSDPRNHLPAAGRAALALLAALAVPLVAGCGGEEDKGGEKTGGTSEQEAKQPAGKPVATVTVSETEYKLRPSSPAVPKAGVVEFTARNDGKIDHSLEVEGPGGEAETKVLKAGQSAKVKVDLSKPGTYTMYCPVGNHRQLGMVGKVKVAGGGSGGGAKGGGSTDGEY